MPEDRPHLPRRGYEPTVTKEDFALLATLAWLKVPGQALATQIAEETGQNQRTCQYWLSPHNDYHAPPEIVARAYRLAHDRFPLYADLLDKLDALMDGKAPETRQA